MKLAVTEFTCKTHVLIKPPSSSTCVKAKCEIVEYLGANTTRTFDL